MSAQDPMTTAKVSTGNALRDLYEVAKIRSRGPRHVLYTAVRAKRSFLYNRFIHRDAKDILVLMSIRKSGTNYLKYVITNYLRLLKDPAAEPVTYEEMSKLLPNQKRIRPYRYLPPSSLTDALVYKDIRNTHNAEYLKYSKSDVILLYRNPLDHIVSMFYYKYKFQPSRSELFKTPSEILDITLPGFIYQYKLIKEVCRTNKRTIVLSYESLMRSPFDVVYTLLMWMRAPMDVAVLKKALEYSSFENIRKQESRLGPIGLPEGSSGVFTRDGRIGQWKDYFNQSEVEHAKAILKKGGISPTEFIFE